MTRHLLTDVVAMELRQVSSGRWEHFAVTSVMSDGARSPQPAVNTIAQALERKREWFPDAVPFLAD